MIFSNYVQYLEIMNYYKVIMLIIGSLLPTLFSRLKCLTRWPKRNSMCSVYHGVGLKRELIIAMFSCVPAWVVMSTLGTSKLVVGGLDGKRSSARSVAAARLLHLLCSCLDAFHCGLAIEIAIAATLARRDVCGSVLICDLSSLYPCDNDVAETKASMNLP